MKLSNTQFRLLISEVAIDIRNKTSYTESTPRDIANVVKELDELLNAWAESRDEEPV